MTTGFLRTWGNLSCFARLEIRGERVSYPIRTPSAELGDPGHSPSRWGWHRVFARLGCISGWHFRWLCLIWLAVELAVCSDRRTLDPMHAKTLSQVAEDAAELAAPERLKL